MKPVHWYHLWVGDYYHTAYWESPAEEHFGEMRNARFEGDVKIGLVGGLTERAAAMRWLREWWPEATIAVATEEGFEQVTIDVMHEWCKTADPATPVYYAHDKGALNCGAMNRRWRMAMDHMLMGSWENRVEDLKTHDAVGMHWLTDREFPQNIDPRAPMFGGNFWWANAGYLAKLPLVQGGFDRPPVNRWGAEGWMGRGFPKVRDLKPGWPDYTHD